MELKKIISIKIARELIQSYEFKEKYKNTPTAFTRTRKLHFPILMILMLQKGLKSLQLRLNEFVLSLDNNESISNSAFTQARANLDYKAFIELNQKCIIDVMYRDNNIKTYKGMRVLGIDGSKIILPSTQNIIDEFGEVPYGSKETFTKGTYCYALTSTMYDVLNRVVIDSSLNKFNNYEVDLAIKHLEYSSDSDLLIYDRGYPSYRHLAHLCKDNKKFVMRCSSASFKDSREMLKGKGASDRIVQLKVHHAKSKEIEEFKLAKEIKVRFIRVVLETGKYEVLVTNLLDEVEFPIDEFAYIYYLRWGVEEFYGIIKNRLTLENFSGKTAHSIYQDFYATIYLSGLETLLTSDVNVELQKKKTKNRQQVNHAVSFNIIKNKALKLLLDDNPPNNIIEQLELLFKTNPVQIRPNRKVPRVKTSDYKLYNYHKRTKKICF
jgi:hypothetical protein